MIGVLSEFGPVILHFYFAAFLQSRGGAGCTDFGKSCTPFVAGRAKFRLDLSAL
jgi:hypothetical protein